MPPKPASVKNIITRSQSKAKTQVAETQTDTEFCVCPHPTHKVSIMEAAQKEELTNLFKEFATALRGDLEKESHAQHTKLDLMQAHFNTKPTAHNCLRLQPTTTTTSLLTFLLWGQPLDPSDHCQTVNSLILG